MAIVWSIRVVLRSMAPRCSMRRLTFPISLASLTILLSCSSTPAQTTGIPSCSNCGCGASRAVSSQFQLSQPNFAYPQYERTVPIAGERYQIRDVHGSREIWDFGGAYIRLNEFPGCVSCGNQNLQSPYGSGGVWSS